MIIKPTARIFSLVFAATLGTCTTARAAEWADLFNGRDLEGWVQRGGAAAYTVENGEIVGTSVMNTPNSFLCTPRPYGDFILEYEFKVDSRLNSGVQIRSECFEEPTEFVDDGSKPIKIPAGRVHGYQVEIDPDVNRNRMWTAGLYDEARRGWLYPGTLGGDTNAFSEQGRRIFKQNDWNRVRVEAISTSLKTWLNGTPCAAIVDDVTPRGFIALQVHSINSTEVEGAQVRWRNLRIQEVANQLSDAEREEGWRLLWDGKTSEGWRGAKTDKFPKRGWKIEDGVLTIQESGGGEAANAGDIVTVDRYTDFEFKVDFRITPGANSGIKYFCQPNLDPITGTGAKAANGSAIGLEFQILDDALHPDAKAGRDGNRTMASLYDLIAADAAKRPSPIGEWNTAHIISKGGHIEHRLNGRTVVKFKRGSAEFRDLVSQSKYKSIPEFGEWTDGHILLQDHGNTVSFRNIKLREPQAP